MSYKQICYICDKGNAMLSELGNNYRGTLINYAHSVSNMKTKFNGLTGFFNDVQIKAGQLGKIIIYCDSQAFLELVTRMVKNNVAFA